MFLLWHPSLTAINLSYTFPIVETSATALRGTTGTYILETPPNIWVFNTSRRLGFPPFHGGDLVGGIGPKCPKHAGLGNKNWVCWILIGFLPRIEDLSVRPKPNRPAVCQKNASLHAKQNWRKKTKRCKLRALFPFFGPKCKVTVSQKIYSKDQRDFDILVL